MFYVDVLASDTWISSRRQTIQPGIMGYANCCTEILYPLNSHKNSQECRRTNEYNEIFLENGDIYPKNDLNDEENCFFEENGKGTRSFGTV